MVKGPPNDQEVEKILEKLHARGLVKMKRVWKDGKYVKVFGSNDATRPAIEEHERKKRE